MINVVRVRRREPAMPIRPPGSRRPGYAARLPPLAYLVLEQHDGRETRQPLRTREAVRRAHRTASALKDAPGIRCAYVLSAYRRP